MLEQISQKEEERYIELQLYALNLAREGEVETLQSMLQAGLHPNTKDTKGNSLLMLSAYNGHLECSKMLITQGANVNESNDHGHSILAGVAFKGYLSICKLLVENGALIDRRPLKDPILFAFIFGRRDVVNYLQSQAKPRKIHSFLSKPLSLLKKLKK